LSELISVRPDCKFGFVQVNPWQVKLQKVAYPNETLSDNSMKIRLWKYSFARLFCENQIVKAKFCQFKPWILYHTSEGLSGKLFGLGMCLSSTLTVVKLLYQPKSRQLVYFLQPLKVLPSSAYHLRRPYKRWAMLPFVTGKFACNNSLLNRKQTCWNILKSETVKTNPRGLQPIKIDY